MNASRVSFQWLALLFIAGWVVLPMGCKKTDSRLPIAIMTKLESGSIVGSSEFNAGKLFLEDQGITSIDLVPLNDDWKPDKTKEAYEEFKKKGLRILVTSHVSSCAVAIMDQINQDKVFAFVTGATTDALTGKDDYILRDIQDVQLEQKSIAEYVNALPGDKLVIIRDIVNNAYTEPAKKHFEHYLAKGSVRSCEISTDALDTNAVQTQLQREPFDVVYLLIGGYQSSAVGTLAQLVTQINPSAAIVLTPWVKSPVLLEAAGNAIKNCTLPSHYPPRGQNPAVDTYVDNYKKRFGYAPTFISLNVYTALEILYQAIQNNCTDPDSIKAYILKQKTFHTRFRTTTFDAFGDADIPLYFVTDIPKEF
ncbi:MAG TPA: ABC transporter substrate-binding protein [Candidatus Hydrogenedentes bacterium]|nr:ABC transporter substrate-binding protein [Candidatus Hydrogenedentota bacterium]